MIAFSLTLLVCSAEASDLCSLNPASAEKRIKINGVPGFFFKVHPDGDLISFIEAEHNSMIDLNTGAEFSTTGVIDPVWSPDGHYMTTPTETGIAIYDGNKIIEDSKKGVHKSTPFSLSGMKGVYQSIGKVDGKYKMISDEDGMSISEFESSPTGPKVLSTTAKPCSNIENLGTDLPMISKDGRFISVMDANTKSTKIFKLNGLKCDLAMDLGFGTGKVSFNKDSSQIAFHVDQFSEFQSGYFSGVSADKVKNVVVLNLEETTDGKLSPTSWALASHHTKPGDGGYYPDFDKNGNIYYMEDVGNNFQFVKVNPKNLEFREMKDDLVFGKKHCVNCEAMKEKTESAHSILAKMWKDACKSDSMSGELVMGIAPEDCSKMVNDFYVPSLGKSKEDLLKSCPQNPHKKGEDIGEWNLQQKTQAEALVKGKCLTCHRQSKTYEEEVPFYVMTSPDSYDESTMKVKKKLPPFNLEKLNHATAEHMMESIKTNKMPKKEPLTDEQRKMVLDYLQKRMLDMPPREYEPSADNFNSVRRYTDEHLEKIYLNSTTGYMGADETQKRSVRVMVNCIYGQKDCDEYLVSIKPVLEMEASLKPEAERAGFLENRMMEVRCSNLIGVTSQQCIDWQVSRKK